MRHNAIPYWPAAMKRKTVSQYADLGEAAFMRLVEEGTMPKPFKLGRSDHWSRASIDKAIAELTGAAEPDWRSGSPLYR